LYRLVFRHFGTPFGKIKFMMSVHEILLFPANQAELRTSSEPVKSVDRSVKKLIKNLKDTLASHPEGVGLAAPQINFHKRVIIVRLGTSEVENSENSVTVLVNPEIIESHSEQIDFDGCLSFPGLYAETIRPHYLRITGLDEEGNPIDRIFEGFDAVVVHHEIDHLDGVLFIDRINSLEDLYRLGRDSDGNMIRVPISEQLKLSKLP
jgi:peptide deformylase